MLAESRYPIIYANGSFSHDHLYSNQGNRFLETGNQTATTNGKSLISSLSASKSEDVLPQSCPSMSKLWHA